MGKIVYPIRLYKVHDLDLITFMETREFNIVKAMYCALSAYSTGDVFVIDVPPRRSVDFKIKKRVYFKQLSLDEDIDYQAISVLEKIAPGYRNNFLKNLLRQYLCTPLSEEFLIDKTSIDSFFESFSIFKNGKRVAKAGNIKKRKNYTLTQRMAMIFDDNSSVIKEDAVTNKNFVSPVKKVKTAPGAVLEKSKTSQKPKTNSKGEDGLSEDLTDVFSALLN